MAAELARLDRGVLKSWLQVVGAVESLGGEHAGAYTELVLSATRRRPKLGRSLTLSVPDHLARVAPETRGEYLRLLALVVKERPQAAGMVARTLPELMERLEGPALARFLSSGLDLHEGDEQVAESFLKNQSHAAQKELERLTLGLPLKSIQRTLSLYARAHCGDDVQVRGIPPGQKVSAFSEGRHIHLPERIDRYGDERDFTLYRVLTARTAAYLEFGTFDLDLRELDMDLGRRHPGESDIELMLRGYANRSLARDLFQVVEDARVEASMCRHYPGLKRDLAEVRPEDLAERPALEDLAPVEALVESLLQRTWGVTPSPDERLGDTVDRAWDLIAPLLAEDTTVLEVARLLPSLYPIADGLLRKVQDSDKKGKPPSKGSSGRGGRTPETSAGREGEAPEGAYRGLESSTLGTGIRPEEMDTQMRDQDEAARDVREAMEEEGIEAAISEIRKAMKQHEQGRTEDRSYEEMIAFLERMPAPEGGLVEEGEEDRSELPPTPMRPRFEGPLELEEDPDAKVFHYKEWDDPIGDYKPSWVRLKEHKLRPGEHDFVTNVLDEYGDEIRQLRRRFQALRPEELRRVKGLTDGDELDLDRVIEARVARRAGTSPTDRIYARHLRNRRDVAVAFLLDMSSSTNESHQGMGGKRIIQIEKEALVMIAEAVDAIGDACAIYGFSGYGREHVAFYLAKDFKDAYDDAVRERIGRMNWKMENRDGAAIRHATAKLLEHPARTRLLVLLSDGRPLDCGCDQYFDRYAAADTRQALREARADGVHPFCITVDPRGSRYLEEIYGEVGYIVIDDVTSLPHRLPSIYRRLTR